MKRSIAMKILCSPDGGTLSSNRNAGVALVITLIFVMLLTGVLIAFFSRAMASRQVANSSAKTTEVALFADGAVDAVLGDFKQEIVDGSNETPTGSGVYLPKERSNMPPTRAGTDDSLPNLVKRSASGVKFYANGVARASNASSLQVSANGRKMTPARWNKSLLTTRDPANTSATDFTPVGASAANNTWAYAPDWVLVARDGSNPTVWASSSADATASNNRFVVGRYAYMIYDEGGLLDANAAGYPSGTPTTPALANAAAYRPNMAFADLKQLPGLSTLSSTNLRNSAVDLLTKVRNYTSWDSDASASAENYFRFVLFSPKGFLSVGNTALKNNRSDVLFGSRQDLLQFLLQAMPTLGSFGSGDKAELRQKLPDALPYLTHFSRSLEQPSVAPDKDRPKIVSGTGGNSAAGNEDPINPVYLNVRVQTTKAGGRYDGTDLTAGEPLVKTRFALNRLAWLTFKGPIATGTGTTGPLSTDPDLQNLIAELKRRGFTDDFLKRGTTTTIKNFFGLSWGSYTDPESASTTSVWRYDVHNGGGNGTGTIMRLSDIAAQGREPDFVELLKATINVGSIAKGCYTESPVKSTADFPPLVQYIQDTSTDFAILQIAANIIDQFDLDGFPTRIRFNTGGDYPEQEFDGVENLPYFYRARISGVEPREADPLQYYYENKQINDTGAYVALETPEIWNPHDANVPRCALDATGKPLTTAGGLPLFPTSFRVVANSIDPNHIGTERDLWIEGAEPSSQRSWNADTTGTPPPTPPSAPFNGDFHNKPITLTANTTALEFNVPNTTQGQGLFREPTMLMQLNVPAGSNLHPGAGNYLKNPTSSAIGARLNGLVDADGTILNAPSKQNPNNPDGERYIGMFLSTVPAQWAIRDSTTNASRVQVLNFFIGGASQTRFVTFRVQALDPTNTGVWATYDRKYVNAISDEGLNQDSSKRFSVSGTDVADHFAVLGDERAESAWDPRTSRFASPELARIWAQQQSKTFCEFPLTTSDATRYGALSNNANALVSDRPDSSSGFDGGENNNGNAFWLQGLPNVGGWSPNSTSLTGPVLWHLGMISQNSTGYAGDGRRTNGDLQSVSAGAQYYSDPDGVVRGAMGAYATGTASDTVGLPMMTATVFNTGGTVPTAQAASRPMILNRPFQSVAELGYVFSGTPWKNLNFFTPESGDTGLLDVFCLGEANPGGLGAGKVNLNTRQVAVLQAILAGAYKDDQAVSAGTLVTSGTTGEAALLANKLVARTSGVSTNGQSAPSGGAQPLRNLGEIVGSMITPGTPPTYDGFCTDISAGFLNASDQKIQRRREAPIRALAACGQTRVWNLMIDVVAQTGRYPVNATGADRFLVEGEQRQWVHVAIDRLTGTIIDKQVEVVHE